MALTWTYSDYVTLAYGAARLARFRLHVQEVSDAVQKSRSGYGRSVSSGDVQQYLSTLLAAQRDEERKCDAAAGSRTMFTRGRIVY
jgi:hypothetical protein